VPESNPTRIASTPTRIAVIHAIRTIKRPAEGVNSHPESYHRALAIKGGDLPPGACPKQRLRGARQACPRAEPIRPPTAGKKRHVGRIKGPPGRRLQRVGERRRFERLALAALLAALLLAASAPPSGAVVTIGSNLARAPNSAANYSPRPTFSNSALAPDLRAPGGVSSPVNGTVVRWRIRVGDSTRVTNLRIVRPLGGGLFTGTGTSPSVLPPINATTTYDAQLPIRIGDYIGIDCCAFDFFEPDAEFFVAGNAAVRNEWQPRLADGGAGRAPLRTNAYEIAVNAEINPTSTFTLHAVSRNKRTGTATITAKVPNPGQLTGSGKAVNAAAITKRVRTPGRVRLLIKAKGRKKRKLNATGKVKVRPKITFTPTGGSANTLSATVKLIKR
jgi:hypothetical protein